MKRDDLEPLREPTFYMLCAVLATALAVLLAGGG